MQPSLSHSGPLFFIKQLDSIGVHVSLVGRDADGVNEDALLGGDESEATGLAVGSGVGDGVGGFSTYRHWL